MRVQDIEHDTPVVRRQIHSRGFNHASRRCNSA
jgi:hypothetical protein